MLEICAVSKSYRTGANEVTALRDVDLTVGSGELVAIMGPSGCGKSTLLHVMGALDTPTSGDVVLEGRRLGDLSDTERTTIRRDDVGFVFQFFNLVPVLTVAENIALPAVVGRMPAKQRAERLAEVLDLVGLAGLADRMPNQLSGGQQQRVAIGRALFNRPSLLLADEPTGNLDHAAGREILDLFCSLHASGQTVVIVTHDPGVAAAAQRVVFLHDGRVVADVQPRSARSLLRRLTSLQPA
ncbi:MAG TPA: ABC transporter ATP-binding protein [Acidimicrobiales bacterium]|jgi:putative ABC transport system ATP-binding protein|nr:ABC transporter ATP-binding protein [Acidimicrobiales bacterium]